MPTNHEIPENPVVARMIDEILADVRVELIKATEKHGFAPSARKEALQLAAVAVRYVLDLCTSHEQFDAVERRLKEKDLPHIYYDPTKHMLPSEAIDRIAERKKKRRATIVSKFINDRFERTR